MERKVIDCPETQKREEIDFERTPCGVVIAGCSRFEPQCAVACGARCAAILDKRDRRGVDDIDPRVLVVYAGGDGRTKAIANALAVHLSCDRLTVEVADASGAPPAPDYDAVVIGSFVHRNRHPRSVIEYIAHNCEAVAAMPAFFFSVGDNDDLHREWRATGWLPNASAIFEPPRDRGPIESFVSWLSHRDVSPEDSQFAYSTAVRDFALKIAENIPSPGLVVTMRPACKSATSKR